MECTASKTGNPLDILQDFSGGILRRFCLKSTNIISRNAGTDSLFKRVRAPEDGRDLLQLQNPEDEDKDG